MMRTRGLTVVVALAFSAMPACGSASGPPAEAVAPTVVELPGADDTAPDVSVPDTAAPSTTRPAVTTTRPAPTTVAPTAAPTVVETLPTPAPAPEPRADEPYLELGTLEIPDIGLSQPLLEGISLNTLDLGPGHWPGTALPGQLGNVVVAGHRTSHGKVFRNLDQLVPGAEVVFTTPEGRFVYHVTETTIVAPDALYIIEQTEAHTATLFACHPPGSTRQRIVVHLELGEG